MSTSNLAQYIPALRYKPLSIQQTWSTTGNTQTVTDANVETNSVIFIMHTSAHTGLWYVSTITSGTSFVITSSTSEASGRTFRYLIL